MEIGGTHINYYFICRRKLWLYARGVRMESGSDLVDHGRLVHERSYPERRERYRELQIGGAKIDFFDPQRRIIHELKKSSSYEDAHVWQLKFYIHLLEANGVIGVRGILEYPLERRIKRVRLSRDDRAKLARIQGEIHAIVAAPQAPERKQQSQCRNCAYFDFCWVGELDA